MAHGPSPWPGRRRALAVPAALTSVLTLAFDVSDADAEQRRAQLAVRVTVTGGCSATAGSGGAATIDPACAAAVRPATLIESGPSPAAVAGSGPTPPEATVVTGPAGADGTQYLTLIY